MNQQVQASVREWMDKNMEILLAEDNAINYIPAQATAFLSAFNTGELAASS